MRRYSKRKLWLGVVTSAAFVAMVFFLMGLESSPGIPRDKAIAIALEEARGIGLTGEPTSIQAVATSYGSYRAFMNQPPSPVSGEASREVWVISFTGEVDLRMSVPPVPEGFNEKPVEYNNVIVVINRNTGRAFESSAGPVGSERDLSPLE